MLVFLVRESATKLLVNFAEGLLRSQIPTKNRCCVIHILRFNALPVGWELQVVISG